MDGGVTSSVCCCTMVDMTCDEMLNLERSTAVGMRPSTDASTVQKAVQTCERRTMKLKTPSQKACESRASGNDAGGGMHACMDGVARSKNHTHLRRFLRLCFVER